MRAEPQPDPDRGAAGQRGHRQAGLPGSGLQESLNLYAPPKARVEPSQQVGELWRSGKLVRMDRDGALPDRCVVCNADAGYKLTRTLYASPLAWRIVATATPFTLLGISIVAQVPVFAAMFWPLVLILMIVHTFVRQKIVLEFGLCRRHRRMRMALGVAAIASMAILPLTAFTGYFELPLLITLIVALLILALAWANSGAQAVTLSKVSAEHLWLARTGEPFRRALPELPASR